MKGMAARRIGVMGGMFDPVHLGHLEAANVAIETLGLQELRMVPCHVPNHRVSAHASAADRLAMLRLATTDYHRVVIDDRECLREGVSYTVDTLASIAQENPDAILILVLGIDAFAKLPTWHRWQALFMMAHILVLDRPGPVVTIDPDLDMDLECREVDDAERMFWGAQGKILRLGQPQIDISSTAVREQLSASGDAVTNIPRVVKDYIQAHSLYQNTRHPTG
jgi:nicotinate-nucleotide adenylyltransferase